MVPSHKIKIVISGDLAFYSTMLGKPGMDSKWCHLCNLGAAQWSNPKTCKGVLWNRENMNAILEQINDDSRKMKPNERKGIKFKPILEIDALFS